MNSESIIQRLLSEGHITAEEAMILLKDITKYYCPSYIPEPNYPYPGIYPNYPIVYCSTSTAKQSLNN